MGGPHHCDHELVRLALKHIARGRGTDQRQAAALTERNVLTIRARLGDGLKDARDLAMLLVAATFWPAPRSPWRSLWWT